MRQTSPSWLIFRSTSIFPDTEPNSPLSWSKTSRFESFRQIQHYIPKTIFACNINKAMTWSSWLSPLGSWTLASRRWFCSSLVWVPRISLGAEKLKKLLDNAKVTMGKLWGPVRKTQNNAKKITQGKLSGPVNAIIFPFRLGHLRKPLSCQAESKVVKVALILYSWCQWYLANSIPRHWNIPGPFQGMRNHQVIEEGSILLPHLKSLCTF